MANKDSFNHSFIIEGL